MKTLQVILVSALGLIPFTAMAQKWEMGAVGGGSFYTSNDATRGTATAKASFSPGFAVGFVLGQDMGRYWGGDIRYTFERNDAKVDGNGGKATFAAQSHSIHYDFLLHLSPAGQKMRPYIAFGAGIRQYRGTGVEAITQPLSDIVILTKTTDTTPMVSVGFGVKLRVGAKSNVRVEVKDYITPVPTKIFFPNRGAELGGWLHNFAPMIGVTYVF